MFTPHAGVIGRPGPDRVDHEGVNRQAQQWPRALERPHPRGATKPSRPAAALSAEESSPRIRALPARPVRVRGFPAGPERRAAGRRRDGGYPKCRCMPGPAW